MPFHYFTGHGLRQKVAARDALLTAAMPRVEATAHFRHAVSRQRRISSPRVRDIGRHVAASRREAQS